MQDLKPKHQVYPFFKNNRYYNFPLEKKVPFIIPTITMLLRKLFKKKQNVDLSNVQTQSKVIQNSHNLNITWIGHSSFLIQLANINILTDPIFFDLFLFPRLVSPGIAVNDLPKIDFVLISHNHRDHMDKASLLAIKTLNPEAIFLVPKGDKAWFIKNGLNRVFESMWWDKLNFKANNSNIEFRFLPAKHWSRRSLFDYNKSLWGSWMISFENQNIYFAGDSAYSDYFKNINIEYKSIDVALMPIGPCEPEKWMAHAHLNAEKAGEAFIDLNAKSFIPMHWGTYGFGVDEYFLPIDRLTSWWESSLNDKFKQLHILKIGESKQITFDISMNESKIYTSIHPFTL